MNNDFAVAQSEQDVEEILLAIHDLQLDISAAKEKRDHSISFFNKRIEQAKQLFADETKFAESEIARLSYSLEVYLKNNPPKNKKSIPFSGGTIGWRKQPPKFFFDDTEVSPDNAAFFDFIKKSFADFIKTKESVDWANFKTKLIIDGDAVYFADTGEFIDGLKAQILPDKFSVKIND